MMQCFDILSQGKNTLWYLRDLLLYPGYCQICQKIGKCASLGYPRVFGPRYPEYTRVM
jgi:hypothetical protein